MLVNGLGRRLDGVRVLLVIVRVCRALARRGIGVVHGDGFGFLPGLVGGFAGVAVGVGAVVFVAGFVAADLVVAGRVLVGAAGDAAGLDLAGRGRAVVRILRTTS